MPDGNPHADDSSQGNSIEDSLVDRWKGLGISDLELPSNLRGHPLPAEVKHGSPKEPVNSPDVCDIPPEDTSPPGRQCLSEVPDISSLAIDVANDASFINDENIPPLDLGSPFGVFKTFWEVEKRESRATSAPRPNDNDSTEGWHKAHEAQSRGPTGHRELADQNRLICAVPSSSSDVNSERSQSAGAVSPDNGHLGSPRSFSRRSNVLRDLNSSSPDDGAEIFTASLQHLHRVRFVRRIGNGHYADFEADSDVIPQPSHVPVVYGRVIDIKPRRPHVGSPAPTAIVVPQPSTDKPGQKPSTAVWEDAVAAANELFELEQGSAFAVASQRVDSDKDMSGQEETVIRRRKILGELPLPESAVRGSRFVGLVNGKSKSRKISPILIDFSRTRGVATPSIHSYGSEFDCNSPLFGQSRKAELQKAHQEPPRRNLEAFALLKLDQADVCSHNRVIEWLRNTVTPDPETRTESVQTPRSFNVWNGKDETERAMKRRGRIFGPEDFRNIWEHERTTQKQSGRSDRVPSPKNVLKDVTNVRRPGYLEHNSFFKDSRAPAPGGQSSIAGPSAPRLSKGTSIYSSATAYARKHWPSFLAQHPLHSREHMQTVRAALEGYTIEDSPSPGKPLPSPPSPSSRALEKFSPAPSRKAAYEDALARLEGRAPPLLTSPITRYVRPEMDLADEHIHIEEVGPVLRQPTPLSRTISDKAVQKWESTVGSAKDHGSIASQTSSRSRRGFCERPSNPTPGRGHWYYEAQEAHGRQ